MISIYNLHILIFHGNFYLNPVNIYGTGWSSLTSK
jgi:hypothetical protein